MLSDLGKSFLSESLNLGELDNELAKQPVDDMQVTN
jgi:hypothetical protein